MARRRGGTGRDMVLSLSVLLAVVLVITGVTMGFSFSPGRPSVNTGAQQSADVITGFEQADRVLSFPIAVPRHLPADWHPSSFALTNPDTAPVGSLPTVQGGWLTPDNHFITLIEARGSAPQVLQAQVGGAADATGTVHAGGATWTVVPGLRKESAWFRTAGPATYLITGDADEDAFRTLAESIQPPAA